MVKKFLKRRMRDLACVSVLAASASVVSFQVESMSYEIDHERAAIARSVKNRISLGTSGCEPVRCMTKRGQDTLSFSTIDGVTTTEFRRIGDSIPCRTEIREGGNLKEVAIQTHNGVQETHYRKNGKKDYYNVGGDDIGIKDLGGLFYEVQGESKILHPFSVEKGLNSELTEDKYFELLKKAAPDRKSFFRAEEILEIYKPGVMPCRLIIKIREHYKKKLGIDNKLKDFSDEFGFNIDTDMDWFALKYPRSLVKFVVNIFNKNFNEMRFIQLSKVELFIEEITTALRNYPTELHKKSGLSNIHLMDVRGSGYVGLALPFSGRIFMFNKDGSDVQRTIHHEYSHQLRNRYWYKKSARGWGRKVFGKHYKSFYKNGPLHPAKKMCLISDKNNPSFVSDYARKNEDEDQSETAEHMFSQSLAKDMAKKVAKNVHLRRKFELCLKFYSELSPLINTAHLAKIAAKQKFGPIYWERKRKKVQLISFRDKR